MNVVRVEDLRPKLELTTLDKVPRLLLEHGILVRDVNELVIAEALRVRDVGEVGVAGLAELANHERLIQLLIPGEY